MNHSRMVIVALTLAAWWLQLKQYVSGGLKKLLHKNSP